ncbi:hypothetical protein OF83DRAFT_1280682 [Amylostereum chailletii]|nr:hypothetical protein OF83DRAFT_1280682 [Amylostereum chailletii]
MTDSPAINDDGSSAQGYWLSATFPRMAFLSEITPKSPPADVTHALQSVDDEIEAAFLAICAMRSRRNGLSPIAILPPEMIAQVFEFSALMDPPQRGRPGPLGWIRVAHVCRAWRQVALQYPTLWTNIHFTLGATWTEAFFTRAKSAPISIKTTVNPSGKYVDRVYKEYPFDADIIRSHLWHTASLELDGNMTSLNTVIQSLSLPAPKLEVLKLTAHDKPTTSYSYSQSQSLSRTRPFLPPDFLGKDTPSLRHVALRDISFSWTSLPFRTLASLTISMSRGEDPDKSLAPHIHHDEPFSSLVAALDAMTGLEELALDGCIPSRLPVQTSSNTANLPRLTSLTLAGPVERLADLWRSLHISPFAKLYLKCALQSSTIEAAYDVLSMISTHLSAPERSEIPILTFHISSTATPGTLTARTWHHSKLKEAPSRAFSLTEDTDVNLSFWLFAPTSIYQRFPDGIVQRMCDTFPLKHLKALHLEAPLGNSEWSKKNWVKRFGPSKALEHVCVFSSVAYGFCRALAGLASSSSPGNRKVKINKRTLPLYRDAVFLPSLCYVSLEDVDFDTECPKKPLYTLLPEWLENRTRFGAPLAHLNIINCTVLDEWIDELVEKVPTVTWDDYRGDLEPSEEEDEEDEDEDEDDMYLDRRDLWESDEDYSYY